MLVIAGMSRSWRLLALWAALAGCSGGGARPAVPDGAGEAGGASAGLDAGARDLAAGEAAESVIPPLPDKQTVPGPAPLRRLTVNEYRNTIRDLVGGTPSFTPERVGHDIAWYPSGFARGGWVTTGDDVRDLIQAAEGLAPALMQRLPALLPCSVSLTTEAQEEACAGEFIERFGLRAFRRPLEAREQDRLRALYRTLRGPDAGDTFAEAIADLAAAMIESPEFLYRWELGPYDVIRDGPLVRFNGFELASRLSYLFWDSMPDDQLFAAARDGQLQSTTQLVKQARRLLADPRARDGVTDFHHQWLQLAELEGASKDATFKDFSPALVRAMIEETHQFAASVFLGPGADGKIETLLKGTASFVAPPLARLYGVPEPAGPGLEPVSLPANERAGILTRAAFLTSTADTTNPNPIDRGTFILHRLLCLNMVEPDNLVIPDVRPPNPGATNRERFEAHGREVCATSCHAEIVDPMGYAFENYDAIGAWRTTDNGKPVNARASAPIGMQKYDFNGAIELMDILSRSDEVRSCLSRQWLRYMLGRPEIPDEDPSVAALTQVLRDSGGDLRELIVALVRSRTFTHRTRSPGEAP
jgi:hypothetical protein